MSDDLKHLTRDEWESLVNGGNYVQEWTNPATGQPWSMGSGESGPDGVHGGPRGVFRNPDGTTFAAIGPSNEGGFLDSVVPLIAASGLGAGVLSGFGTGPLAGSSVGGVEGAGVAMNGIGGVGGVGSGSALEAGMVANSALPAGGMAATGAVSPWATQLGSTVAGGASGTMGSGFAGTSLVDIGGGMGIAADGTIIPMGAAASGGTGLIETAAVSPYANNPYVPDPEPMLLDTNGMPMTGPGGIGSVSSVVGAGAGAAAYGAGKGLSWLDLLKGANSVNNLVNAANGAPKPGEKAPYVPQFHNYTLPTKTQKGPLSSTGDTNGPMYRDWNQFVSRGG